MLQQVTIQNFNEMLGRFSTAELETMVEKFPYFQEAHLLLAKKYQDESNPAFDRQLQIAALYANNRELLFQIFHKGNVAPVIKKAAPVPPAPPVLEEQVIAPAPPLETLAEVTLQTIEKPVTESETPPVITIVEPEPAVTEPPVTTVYEAPVTGSEAPAIEATEVQEAPVFSTAEPHTFNEWLRAFSATPIQEAGKAATLTPTQQDEELNKIITQNLPAGYLIELVKEETNYSKGLDKFIEEQIERHRKTPAKNPVSDAELDPALVTETMARVYEMQKKYSRAIKAYQLLALKFPEKNDFFAARINYLKNIV
ncbi:MAG TPA: hypothetical protein VG603_01695 [Chitinophagales bacterium]|nr:hypothetical protein [Chitinophagales bacterium]